MSPEKESRKLFMMGRIGLAGMLLCLVTVDTLSKQASDFSPIFVGAIWRYSESNSNRISAGPANSLFDKWSGAITIKVVGEIILADTIKYTAQFKDSMFSRSHSFGTPTYPDSIAEFAFNIIDDGSNNLKVITPFYDLFLNKVFLRHSFPDSIVADTVYSGRKVEMAYENLAYYGKDIGLLQCWNGRNGHFYLQEFVGKQFSINFGNTKVIGKKLRDIRTLEPNNKCRDLLGRLNPGSIRSNVLVRD